MFAIVSVLIISCAWIKNDHHSKHQCYFKVFCTWLLPITKTIQVRRTRHAGHCWRSRDELISDVLLWTPTHGRSKADDQHEHTFSNYVRIRDVVLKTCLGRWTMGKSGERGSGISVLPARHDDDDDISVINILFVINQSVYTFWGILFIYIHVGVGVGVCVRARMCVCVCVCVNRIRL